MPTFGLCTRVAASGVVLHGLDLNIYLYRSLRLLEGFELSQKKSVAIHFSGAVRSVLGALNW
jgi:hypothetical protein